jgi:uracil-DNA glycosylase
MEPKYPGCNCEECPMKDEGFVPPSGPEDSDILFIGQAPA